MICFFSSEYTSALKLNGIYYGAITDVAREIKIESENTFIEVLPLCDNEKPVCALLNQTFFQSPPNRTCITNLKGAYLIKFLKGYSNGEFGIINQQRYPDALVTVYNDKGAKLSIDGASGFFMEKIQFEFNGVEFFRINSFSCNREILGVVFFGKDNLINLYDLNGENIRCIFSRRVNEYSFENEFSTTENLCDMAKHKIACTWDYDGKIMQEKSKTVSKSDTFCVSNLTNELLPFAFTEELFAGGDIREYLAENMLNNADKLRGFFGNFIGVFPPPYIKDKCVGVVYPNGNNKYLAGYFYFEIENGKITNIKKED